MAPVDLNKNKKQILDAHKEVFDLSCKTNWALFGYEGQSDILNLVGKGDGGLEEFVGELLSGRIMYGYLKIIDPNSTLPKFVFVNWQGDGVPEIRKGNCASHLRDVSSMLRGSHVTINARCEEDLDEKDVMALVAKSSGANYGFHKETPQKEILVVGPVGSVYEKVKPQVEIKPKHREKFWEETAKEQQSWQTEEVNRKKIEREKLENEIRERELKNAKDREAKENQRFAEINKMKTFEKNANTVQQDIEWKNEAADDEAERATRSEQMRKERAAEAQKLIASRNSNVKEVFEQGRVSQFDLKNSTAPPKKVIRDFPKMDQPVQQHEVPPHKELSNQIKDSTYKMEETKPEPDDIYDDAQHTNPYLPSPTNNIQIQRSSIRDEDENNTDDKEKEDQDIYDDAGQSLSKHEERILPSNSLTAKALFDYQAVEENELTFDPDDIITNIDMVDEGWWIGDFGGVRGMFPANYVELI